VDICWYLHKKMSAACSIACWARPFDMLYEVVNFVNVASNGTVERGRSPPLIAEHNGC
jgi:hypothetical protein